jgi:hypothetical protein
MNIPLEKRILIFGVANADRFNAAMKMIQQYGAENFKSQEWFDKFIDCCSYDSCIDYDSIAEAGDEFVARYLAHGFATFNILSRLREEDVRLNEASPVRFILRAYGSIITDIDGNFLASIMTHEMERNQSDTVKKIIERIQTGYNAIHCIATDIEEMVF